MSLSALNKWEYDFPNKEADVDELKNIQLKLRDNVISDFSLYASDPFRDFAYSITKDNNWLEYPSLTFFNHKFLYLGIQFLHLNCLELYHAGMIDNQWKSLDSIFQENNSILFVSGHSHADLDTKKTLQLSDSSELCRSSAATLFCTPEIGETRGFNIITLKRTDYSIKEIEVRKYNLRNDGSIEKGKLITKSL